MPVASSRPSPYIVAFLLGETGLMVAATLLAIYFRTGSIAEIFTWRYSWHRIILVPLVMQITYYYFDVHNFRVARGFIWNVFRITQATAAGTLALAVIYYVYPRLLLGRGVLIFSSLFTIGLVAIWWGLYGWALQQRLFATKVLLLASGSLADSILEELVSRSDNIYNVVCIVDMNGGEEGAPEGRALNLLGAWARLLRSELRHEANELVGLHRHYQADIVVVAMDEKRGCMPQNELLRLRMLGVPILSGEDFFEMIAGRILAARIRMSWLIFSSGFATGGLRALAKRLVDVVFSALGLLIASPLVLLTALAVRLESKGPVIFRQERVGERGRIFTMFKFRSMVVDAEAETGPVWAQDGDARATRVGRVIRKTRLDEIPQMYNVLRGDMSFVGPRPERPHFVEQLAANLPYYHERHNVKPGITGWAQVCYPYGASQAAALEKLNYDLYYIKHYSMSLDMSIVLRTMKIILFGGGGR